MMKRLQVDRFEEGFAVLVDDNDRAINVPKNFFGFELHEGDVLDVKMAEGKPVSAVFLEEETIAVKKQVAELMKRIREKNQKK